jgi:hypothetical protein
MNPTYPIEYSVTGCRISSLSPTTKLKFSDGINTYGLYFESKKNFMNISGFPANTFKGDWTIELFMYTQNDYYFSRNDGQIIGSTNSSSLPIAKEEEKPPGTVNVDGKSTALGFKVGMDFTNGKMTGKINSLESRGSSGKETLKGIDAPLTYAWNSIVIQYHKDSTISNYSIFITPRGGKTVNTVNPNLGQTNFGTQGALTTLILGSVNYYKSNVLFDSGASGFFLTNLRISNIARYPDINTSPTTSTPSVSTPSVSTPSVSTPSVTSTPSVVSTPSVTSTPSVSTLPNSIIWCDDPLYKPDSHTVYFNSFNVADTLNAKGYLLSQIVQIL